MTLAATILIIILTMIVYILAILIVYKYKNNDNFTFNMTVGGGAFLVIFLVVITIAFYKDTIDSSKYTECIETNLPVVVATQDFSPSDLTMIMNNICRS